MCLPASSENLVARFLCQNAAYPAVLIMCIVQLEKMQDRLIVHLLLCLCASVRCVLVQLLSKCLRGVIRLFPWLQM